MKREILISGLAFSVSISSCAQVIRNSSPHTEERVFRCKAVPSEGSAPNLQSSRIPPRSTEKDANPDTSEQQDVRAGHPLSWVFVSITATIAWIMLFLKLIDRAVAAKYRQLDEKIEKLGKTAG